MQTSHLKNVQPFWVMAMLGKVEERRRLGLPVYPLEAGQPSGFPPLAARQKGISLLEGDRLGYTESKGWFPLREAIADQYRTLYGVTVNPADVILTPGSSGSFILSFLAAFPPGARIGLAVPGYPAYRNILESLGRTPVLIPVSAESGYRLTPEDVEKALPLDGLMIASPANPTGSMQSPESLQDISRLAEKHRITLLSDELYHGVTYGTMATACLRQYAPDSIIIGSFSKYYAMPGYRLGWMVCPPALTPLVEALIQNLFLAAPTLSQRMALEALHARPELDALVQDYAVNRKLLLDALPGLGFTHLSPADGAFYIYASCENLTSDSLTFCQDLLDKTGVALSPGIDFDPVRGKHHVRFSYAGARNVIEDAIRVLRNTALADL